MVNNKIFILILCCGLSQTYWTCVSEDKGSLLDAPMGISQDKKAPADIYIEDCVIEGMVAVSGGQQGAIRNATSLTATCFAANLNDKTVKPKFQFFILSDVPDYYPGVSETVTIGSKERKKITLSGIKIGDVPPLDGEYYVALYLDPHNEDIDYGDEDLSNNWSEPVEIWIED